MIRPCAALMAWVLVACSPDLAVRVLPIERPGTIVLVYATPTSVLAAHVLDLHESPPPRVYIPANALADQVWAMSYGCPPGALGLTVGPAVIDPDGVALPPSRAVRSASLHGDQISEWGAAEPPDHVAGLRLRGTPLSACSTRKVELALEIPAIVVTARLGQDRFVLGYSNRFEVYRLSDLSKVATLPGPVPGTASSFQDASGAAILVDAIGRTTRIDAATSSITIRAVRASTTTTRAFWASGSDVNDIYLVRSAGQGYHFDGVSWTQIFSLPVERQQDDTGGALWTAAGQGWLLGPRSTDALLVQGNGFSREAVVEGTYLYSVAQVPALGGIVFGTGNARLRIRRGPGTYDELIAAAIGANNRVNLMVPTDDGVLVSNKDARLAEYHSGFGFCGEVIVSQLNEIQAIYPAGPGRWVYVGSIDFGMSNVGVLTLTDPPQRCPD